MESDTTPNQNPTSNKSTGGNSCSHLELKRRLSKLSGIGGSSIRSKREPNLFMRRKLTRDSEQQSTSMNKGGESGTGTDQQQTTPQPRKYQANNDHSKTANQADPHQKQQLLGLSQESSGMKRQHSLSLSVQSSWTHGNLRQAAESLESPLELLKRGYFDINIVLPQNRGPNCNSCETSKNNNQLIERANQQNQDQQVTYVQRTFLTPDKGLGGTYEAKSHCNLSESAADLKLTEPKSATFCSPARTLTFIQQAAAAVVQQQDEMTQTELAINNFLESEAVRPVMLSEYLKALGGYEETLKFQKS